MLIRRFDGTFTISIAGTDLPGTFADRTAARLAVGLPKRVLQECSDNPNRPGGARSTMSVEDIEVAALAWRGALTRKRP
jgi:hypothetical protein